jgi:hypothetical protein
MRSEKIADRSGRVKGEKEGENRSSAIGEEQKNAGSSQAIGGQHLRAQRPDRVIYQQ